MGRKKRRSESSSDEERERKRRKRSKHMSKRKKDIGPPRPDDPRLVVLTEDDYFNKNAEFRVWLLQRKKLYFEQLVIINFLSD